MEIVSEPDIRTPAEASAYLSHLRQILQYVEVCDGNMEEGSLRCDANVSIRKPGDPLGQLVEIKNMNSMRSMERALEFEIQRQIEILDSGQVVTRQTRLWNDDERETFPMRSKEEASDYRYFPDPDLVKVEISREWDAFREKLPELPSVRTQRFINDYRLPQEIAQQLTSNKKQADYFEMCNRHVEDDARNVCHWMLSELLRVQNENRIDQEVLENRIPPQSLAQLLVNIKKGVISGKMGKEILDLMGESGKSCDEIIKEQNLSQISDTNELEEIVKGIINKYPEDVIDYKAGKTKLLGFFMGQVMRLTQGKANPKMVNELLRKKLEEE